jgi:hypothetical protein
VADVPSGLSLTPPRETSHHYMRPSKELFRTAWLRLAGLDKVECCEFPNVVSANLAVAMFSVNSLGRDCADLALGSVSDVKPGLDEQRVWMITNTVRPCGFIRNVLVSRWS